MERHLSPLPPRPGQICSYFLVCLALWGLAACGQSTVSDRIGEQARTSAVVDLAKATDFAWTQVRIYTPYSSREKVCKDLGANAPGCLQKAPVSVPEGEYLLVFIGVGKEVWYVPHHRRNGNFQTSTGVLTMQRDSAVLDRLPPRSPAQGSAFYLQARPQLRPSSLKD